MDNISFFKYEIRSFSFARSIRPNIEFPVDRRYGARLFLGVGMLINSTFGLLVPVAANAGVEYLILVRFIQGLGEVRPLL